MLPCACGRALLARIRPAARPMRRPYSVRVLEPEKPRVTRVADLRDWQPPGDSARVELCGWVRSVRKSAGVRFVDVTDGSSMRPLQLVVDKALSSE